MKAYTLKKNSWHYWLAKKGGLWGNETDICDYIRKVLKGILVVFFVSLAIPVILFIIGSGAWNIFAYLFLGVKLNLFARVTITVLGAIVSFFMLVGFGVMYSKIHDKISDNPGFVTLSYRKFKDKTCALVRFE